jgi:LacI family transcriptional regulator
MVTRDEVARRAGTSSAVVSYVLNNGPRPVSPATRARVLAAIEELGYRPNAVARSLRARRTWTLGLVVPDNSNPFFAEFARAIEDVAFEHGYTLLLGNAMQDDTREASYIRTFLDRQVDGLLLISVGQGAVTMQALGGSQTPLVIVDRLLPGVRAATITVDNQAGGYLATRHLLEHGHTRIGCLSGPSDLTPSAERHRGWARALSEAGLRRPATLQARSDFSRHGGYLAARELLRRRQPPTALFALTDQQGIGALRAAAELGVRVPDELAIVSFDGIPESGFTIPGLSTMQQPIEAMARRAVDRLLQLLAQPDGQPTHDVFPVELLRRGSCGCADPPTRPEGG